MKNIVMNIFSVIIIVICFIFLLLLILLYPHENLEEAIQTLSISIILSVFLAGGIYQLVKK